jgi:hypothetical protein
MPMVPANPANVVHKVCLHRGDSQRNMNALDKELLKRAFGFDKDDWPNMADRTNTIAPFTAREHGTGLLTARQSLVINIPSMLA